MNKVILSGNVASEPKFITTANGTSNCNFSLAVRRKFKNTNGEYETDFFNVQTWRTVADNTLKYVSKGNRVNVIGTLQNRSYTNRDGKKVNLTEIIADEVENLTYKSETTETSKPKQTATQETFQTFEPIDEGSLPF